MGISTIATAFKLLHDKLDGFMPQFHHLTPNPAHRKGSGAMRRDTHLGSGRPSLKAGKKTNAEPWVGCTDTSSCSNVVAPPCKHRIQC